GRARRQRPVLQRRRVTRLATARAFDHRRLRQSPRHCSARMDAVGVVMNEARSGNRDRDSSPSGWLVGAIFLALACLLFYPLHVPYQTPDQDHALVWATSDLARGTWTTEYLPYTNAFPNFLPRGVR